MHARAPGIRSDKPAGRIIRDVAGTPQALACSRQVILIRYYDLPLEELCVIVER
jgi:hypothetical protein